MQVCRTVYCVLQFAQLLSYLLPYVTVTPGTARPVGQAVILVIYIKKNLLEDPNSSRALLLPDAKILQKETEQQALKALVVLNLRCAPGVQATDRPQVWETLAGALSPQRC